MDILGFIFLATVFPISLCRVHVFAGNPQLPPPPPFPPPAVLRPCSRRLPHPPLLSVNRSTSLCQLVSITFICINFLYSFPFSNCQSVSVVFICKTVCLSTCLYHIHKGLTLFDFEMCFTTMCTFLTSQPPEVVRDRQFLTLLTWKCASRHSSVHFSTHQFPRVVRH